MPSTIRHPLPDHPEPAEAGRIQTLGVSPRAVVGTLAVVAAVLAVAGIATQYLWLSVKAGGAGGVISTPVAHVFALDAEGTVPAWFQGSLMLLAAGLFWLASGARRPGVGPHALAWRAMAMIFVLLSCDEVSSVHETFGFWLAARIGGSIGVYAWLLGGVPFVAAVAWFMRGFVRDLPAVTRNGIFAAAGLYLTGAVGVEAIEAVIDATTYGTFTFAVVTTIEESLEMAGLVVLVHVLLGYLRGADPVTVRTAR